ncbi:histidine phosphatase family protein [Arthrobacter sp. ok909]|uniref:SixA phosphatase family protein n=1 Tax=Arthrobacter sp. ok909 TaxID=1761746 RepID=UPI001587D626|nr:phosphoglycerate mutase family protein [Arthrobacter sp. ok909]
MVILIRHADVTLDGGADPPLNGAGTSRAQPLRHVLGDSGVTAIFVSSLQRTQATAQPLAGDLGLPAIVQDDTASIAGAIRHLANSETALVVGHSNTVPDVVARLGGPPMTPIAATEFDRLVFLANYRLCTLRYG